MAGEKFYPPVSTLLEIDSLPDQLGFVKDGLTNLFDDIYYRDLQFSKSARGDAAFYSLSILSKKRVDFEIPGTGIFLILNPGYAPGDTSVFPITLSYEWGILGYIRSFNLGGFSFQAADFFDLALTILGISEQQLIERALAVFGISITDFVNDVNSFYGTTIPLPSGPNPIQEVIDSIKTEPSLQDASTVIFGAYLLDSLSDNNTKEKINTFFSSFFALPTEEFIKDLITPKINATLDLGVGLEFPRNILVPLDGIGGEPIADENVKTILGFDTGGFSFSTETGIGYDLDLVATLSHPSAIGKTGFEIDFNLAKLDISKKTNIPEATADGRPDDFMGVFIDDATIKLPPFFNQDAGSSAVIRGRNLLIGTGGLSGTIGLEAINPNDPNPALIEAKFGDPGSGFSVSLDSVDVSFHQNSIVESNICGTLMIPGFKDTTGADAEININVHIGQDGDFSVTASEDQGITAISIPKIFDFEIDSLTIGREDDRFFVAISGAVDFADQDAEGNSTFIGKFLPDKVEIQKLIIWQDGEIELQGGTIVLPKAISLKIGPVELSITAIGMGSHEQERINSVTSLPELRKYKFFEFAGGVSIDPGGVDARGDGIKFYYTTDNDPGAGRDLHVFVRIQSIALDLIIPGDAKPEKAALLLSGYLSMKEPADTNTNPDAGTEYAGGVEFTLPKLKMGGSAAMRMNPKVPAFIVDVGLEIANPILLGSTGLGIYGFRALVGQRYVTSKTAAGLQPDAEWWQYYKAKVADQYAEGIQVGKFDQTPGFSLGAGVSLATAPDAGKAFSSKIFFLLSLPEVFLLQGQGQILKERIGLDNTTDPPFFAIIAITNSSVEAAFGVDYKVPDDKRPGSIAKVFGILEMGFFWGNSAAWYINVGRDLPEDRRIQVHLLELFNAYFYLMLSNSGIRAGAGASFEVNKKFGPLRAELGAYLDVAGRIQFKPKQMGGSIQLGGHVGLYIFKFGFSISVHASLAAEAPKPFIVTGSLEACIRVLRKDRCAKFNFTWTKDGALDFEPIEIIDTPAAAKAMNMLTQETFNVRTANALPGAGDISSLDNYVVPMDSYIDIEFLKGVLPASAIADLIGGNTQAVKYIDFSAPQKGKSPRVRHEYHLNSLAIKAWNADINAWVTYDIYDAATPLADAPFVTANLADLKSGYWQYQSPNLHNKLRIMAQSPLNFLSQGSGDTIPEDLGIGVGEILCDPDPIAKCCIDFEDIKLNSDRPEVTIPGNELTFFEKFMYRITDNDGHIVIQPYQDYTNALALADDDQIEFFFNEPMACFSVLMQTHATSVVVSYYALETLPNPDESGMPQYNYVLVHTDNLTPVDLNVAITYEDTDHPFDKVVIEAGTCNGGLPHACDADITKEAGYLEIFLSTLAKHQHLHVDNALWPVGSSIYNNVFQFTPLYTKGVNKATVIDTVVTNLTEDTLDFTIQDNTGFSCKVHLELEDPSLAPIDFSQIQSFSNLREDPASIVPGQNFDFLIDANFVQGSPHERVTLKGRSCYTIINCHDDCSTFIYQFCFLSLEDALYNATLPAPGTVQDETDTLVDAFEKSIQPIWRPNTYFSIELNTTDKMFQEGSSSLSASQTKTHVFSFKTEGPIGHFHEFRPEYQALLSDDKEDEFKLSGLQHYIDYTKSFPNADGNVLDAKPLFYVDPKLLLFYKREYVYEMFRGWDELLSPTTYPETEADLEVVIKDPAPDTSISPPGPVASSWVTNTFPLIPGEINTLNNMIENGDPCVTVDEISPMGVNAEFPIFELKPLKLYSAIFNAKFKLITDTNFASTEVHRYVFQTSRYRDFEEQINSYQLLIDEDTSAVLKEAIFDVNGTYSAGDITVAQSILSDTMAGNDPLRQEFALPYDRLFDGVLKIGALHPAVTTEFNVIKDDTTGNILGVLVRNPEPFNDPKLPDAELDSTLQLSANSGSTADYKVWFSKDKRNAFVSNSDFSMNVATGAHQYTFEFKLFDGNAYSVVETVTVDINII